MVARYGGEEFVCVLPGTGEKGAIGVAQEGRERDGRPEIPHEGSTVAEHVTVSIGVATEVPEKGQDTPTLSGKRIALYMPQSKKGATG